MGGHYPAPEAPRHRVDLCGLGQRGTRLRAGRGRVPDLSATGARHRDGARRQPGDAGLGAADADAKFARDRAGPAPARRPGQ